MRPRIKTMKALCATSALGDSRVKTLMDCPQIRRKTTDERMKELQQKMHDVYHRAKYAVKDGRIYIMSRKGGLGENILY